MKPWTPMLRRVEKENCRSLDCPGFPVEPDGFRKAHAVPAGRDRTRGHLWCRVVGNPGPLGMTKFISVADLKVAIQYNLCHPERTPGFPTTRHQRWPRVRLSLRKAA
jgi:hypothetical protein